MACHRHLSITSHLPTLSVFFHWNFSDGGGTLLPSVPITRVWIIIQLMHTTQIVVLFPFLYSGSITVFACQFQISAIACLHKPRHEASSQATISATYSAGSCYPAERRRECRASLQKSRTPRSVS